ncbi:MULTISPECIES: glycosyltransferase family 2 protein [unclassified Lysobacter]|uniref:glycosyltransferase family 2 protein n=1 Tax=unclassified Lysobacter TaxID=2635362 RepID=UPI001BE7C62B|nr:MULTISPECIES: glycosyltransferase family 2 protein [unclassified Lysobacter]MBT2747484.1 glycosyltransferase family 2 protein [Lysobacter sp. ISL-42]MBT2752730.1 glycosyltransferase family 2 protein [Lysobacter sp. ISL-50]MBT2778387.1 glycosyltransferase family 2 protein [Lysobacter sp. ISL-54]MBT2783905.1 glycosyltransferase family 2 protein [Lysobacter sp. ISL-52]
MSARSELDSITAVCVTYNSRALIEDIAAQLRPFARAIVIDNGSSDGTAAEVARRLPWVELIAFAENRGFGAANNAAMRAVATPCALLLNPDCRIEPDSVLALAACMASHGNAALIAPQGWRGVGLPQKSWRPPFFAEQPPGPYRVPDAVVRADWLHGSCLLADTAAFAHIDGFDERFFLYYEDDDLCLRLRAAGYDCLLQPAANAVHPGGGSSGTGWRVEFIKRFHYARSRQIALRRYVGRRAAGLHLARLLAAALPAMAFYSLVGRPRDTVKWAGWGMAALCATLSLNALAAKVR